MHKTDIDEQISGWAYAECHGPVPGVVTAARALNRPIRNTDGEGYQIVLVAGAIHPSRGWIARVQCRCKQLEDYMDVTFRLLLSAGDVLVQDVELPSYNPYFGCVVRHFDWHGDHVVCIYREKHDTYVLAVGPEENRHATIADEWLVKDDMVYSRSETLDHIDQLLLPDLTRLETIPEEQARELGLIPPGYDRANGWRRKWAKRS
jgi:hypothetical protein